MQTLTIASVSDYTGVFTTLRRSFELQTLGQLAAAFHQNQTVRHQEVVADASWNGVRGPQLHMQYHVVDPAQKLDDDLRLVALLVWPPGQSNGLLWVMQAVEGDAHDDYGDFERLGLGAEVWPSLAFDAPE